MTTMQKTFAIFFGISGFILLIAGQYHGYHMAEGEKLVKLWPFWACGGTCVIGSALICRIK